MIILFLTNTQQLIMLVSPQDDRILIVDMTKNSSLLRTYPGSRLTLPALTGFRKAQDLI